VDRSLSLSSDRAVLQDQGLRLRDAHNAGQTHAGAPNLGPTGRVSDLQRKNGGVGSSYITIARYVRRADAEKRAHDEGEGHWVDDAPSDRWPAYPFAVRRAASGSDRDYWTAFATACV